MTTRRVPIVGLATAVILVSMFSPAATPDIRGGFTSENVRWLGNVHVGGFTEGGRLLGRYLYVTDDAIGLVIFDVSNPRAPVRVGALHLPHVIENEDIATNGRIALISQAWFAAAALEDEPVSVLNVVDVSDPGNPHVVRRIPGAGDHTYECLFNCAWAYGGSAAHIVDLRHPGRARVAGNWKTAAGIPHNAVSHDTTEVAPGKLLVAGDGQLYLLGTTDPEHPRLLGRSAKVDNFVIHTVRWPLRGRSPYILSSTESPGPAAHHCTVNDQLLFAYFRVWDATDADGDGLFEIVADYRPRNGTYIDGDPTISTHGTTVTNNGCSTHWFEEHPRYAQNGLVALAAYGHGMKLLRVDDRGEVTEEGFFLPHFDDVGAAYWITDRIVYSVSFERGIDILCYTGPLHGDASSTGSDC